MPLPAAKDRLLTGFENGEAEMQAEPRVPLASAAQTGRRSLSQVDREVAVGLIQHDRGWEAEGRCASVEGS
jgi:hypothetical protein